MELHNKIRFLRLSKNFTQNYMADELGIDGANYGRLERGETGISVDRLKKVAKILGVKTSFLIGDKTNDESEESLKNGEILKEILKEIKTIRTKLTQ
ncbi:MAG: helix-turn-helix transcriptional regulator [Flavobacteriia bacterium]|nr:helix-turn-helix transcriptional regulator [Flavobacteriia bacterium]OJX35340.1 MAG: hypothetical protein BGO87_12095 [Flavobacteriia bacterium 40-80]